MSDFGRHLGRMLLPRRHRRVLTPDGPAVRTLCANTCLSVLLERSNTSPERCWHRVCQQCANVRTRTLRRGGRPACERNRRRPEPLFCGHRSRQLPIRRRQARGTRRQATGLKAPRLSRWALGRPRAVEVAPVRQLAGTAVRWCAAALGQRYPGRLGTTEEPWADVDESVPRV